MRNLHNSLSRSSERAELDIALMDAAKSKSKGTSGGWEVDETFHFIAYVPVNGVLWELDGLRRQPVRLGDCIDGQWLQLATPRIQARIECYSAEEIRFNLLAIAQRPLPLLKTELHSLINLQSDIISHLNNCLPDWSIFSDSVPAADKVNSSLIEKAVKAGQSRDLLAFKKALDRDIAITKGKVADEEEKISERMEYVTRKRHDYSGFIRSMLRKLAERDLVKPYLTS